MQGYGIALSCQEPLHSSFILLATCKSPTQRVAESGYSTCILGPFPKSTMRLCDHMECILRVFCVHTSLSFLLFSFCHSEHRQDCFFLSCFR